MRARDRTRVRVRVRVAFSSSGRRRGALACARSALADVLARVPLEQLCHKLLLVKAELDLLGWCQPPSACALIVACATPAPPSACPSYIFGCLPPPRWLVTPPSTSQPAPPQTPDWRKVASRCTPKFSRFYTVRQYFWNFLGALAHGGRHVALEPLCCGEDKHSTPVLSGALLPYPSTTAPAHPPYPSLRIDPAQPHLNSRPQP